MPSQLATNATAALPGGEGLAGAAMTMVGALFLIIAVLLGGYWLLRRYGPRGGLGLARGDLKLEGQLSLGPKRHVVVVRFLNRRMVLGVTENNINLLTEVKTGDDDEQTADFSSTFKKAQAGDDSP